MVRQVKSLASRHSLIPRTLGVLPFAYTLVAINLWLIVPIVLAAGGAPVAFHDQQRLLQLVSLVVLVALVVLNRLFRRDQLPVLDVLPTSTRVGLGCVIVLGILSSVLAEIPVAAFREVGLFVLLGVLCLAVAGSRRHLGSEFDRRALRVLIWAAATYALVFAVTDLSVDRGSVLPGFSNRRFFGQVCMIVIPLLVAAALQRQGRPAVRLGRWLTAVAWWALAFESDGRSTTYGLLLGVALVPLLLRSGAMRWFRAALATAGGGLVVWVSWTTIFGHGTRGLLRVADRGADDSGRLDMWADTLGLIAGNPLLGVGPEHYAFHGEYLASPHNVPLQFASEWGLIAAVIVGGIAGWGALRWVGSLRRAKRTAPAAERHLSVALTAAAIGTALTSMLEGIINLPVTQMLLVGVIGWMFGLHHEREGTATPVEYGANSVVALTVGAAVLLGMGVIPHVFSLKETVAAYSDAHPDEQLAPRFWTQGRLDFE